MMTINNTDETKLGAHSPAEAADTFTCYRTTQKFVLPRMSRDSDGNSTGNIQTEPTRSCIFV